MNRKNNYLIKISFPSRQIIRMMSKNYKYGEYSDVHAKHTEVAISACLTNLTNPLNSLV
jgi:hypothetical protein